MSTRDPFEAEPDARQMRTQWPPLNRLEIVKHSTQPNLFSIVATAPHWVASVQVNGEYTSHRQRQIVRTFAAAPQMFAVLRDLVTNGVSLDIYDKARKAMEGIDP